MKNLTGKNSIDWGNHIIGFLSALFGILIAFELDQWREQVKENDIATSAFENLKQEIEVNKNMLHEAATVNLGFLRLLESRVLSKLNHQLQFTGSANEADSINIHPQLKTVVFIDTDSRDGGGNTLPAHIGMGNLIHPVFHYSAWESAKATGALNFMPYEKVLSLSSLYNYSRITDELNEVKSLLRKADEVQSKEEL